MEIWKNIPGYEGEYQASTKGRIKSLMRLTCGKNWRTGITFTRTIPERILKPAKYSRCGHLSVILRKGTNCKPVHQLIMKTFVGDAPKGMEVLHINGNPTDNRLSNLRYGTRAENIIDVYWQGRRWRKLSVDDVNSIRFSLFCGFKGCELASMFGVSVSTISAIKQRRTYSWLT